MRWSSLEIIRLFLAFFLFSHILAMNPAKWLQTATSTTKLTHPIRFSHLLRSAQQFHSEPVVFTDEPCVINWSEGIDMLRELNFDVGDGYQDLNTAQEIALGKAVKEKYDTDFFMLDKYPASIRPFYTMPCPNDKLLSNSYDMFIRGQEICSGAQRCHDVPQLYKNLESKGISPEPVQSYIDSFTHGIPPHAGAGIGMERVVFLYLGLDNVRMASMFPRAPNRITP